MSISEPVPGSVTGATQDREPKPDSSGTASEDLARDLRAVATPIHGSRWLLADRPNEQSTDRFGPLRIFAFGSNNTKRVLLVSPDDGAVHGFNYQGNSGTDYIRSQTRAMSWAMDNDIPVPESPPEQPLQIVELRMRCGS